MAKRSIKRSVKKSIKRSKSRKRSKSKKDFYFSPKNPKRSFDVYIDKNPKDTISIKYATIKDVKSTIIKLEKLYKSKEYPHKRIWQVGMIMMVRLRAIKDIKPEEFKLAYSYFKFLGERTKLDEKERFKSVFKFNNK
jgi:hypothetical protein